MKVYYKNNYGQTVDFTALPYIVTEADLFDYKWKYDNQSGLRPKITRFHKSLTPKSLKVALAAKTEDEYKKAWEYLLEVTEKDVMAVTPGSYLLERNIFLAIYSRAKRKNGALATLFRLMIFQLCPRPASGSMKSNHLMQQVASRQKQRPTWTLHMTMPMIIQAAPDGLFLRIPGMLRRILI